MKLKAPQHVSCIETLPCNSIKLTSVVLHIRNYHCVLVHVFVHPIPNTKGRLAVKQLQSLICTYSSCILNRKTQGITSSLCNTISIPIYGNDTMIMLTVSCTEFHVSCIFWLVRYLVVSVLLALDIMASDG